MEENGKHKTCSCLQLISNLCCERSVTLEMSRSWFFSSRHPGFCLSVEYLLCPICSVTYVCLVLAVSINLR